MFDTYNPTWKDIPLSELWRQPKEFIYWFLDKYYEVNINKQTCTDDEWLCIIMYLKSHYSNQFQNPIASFYIHFADPEKNKNFKPNDWEGAYSINLERVNKTEEFQIWCGRFKKRVLPVHYDVGVKVIMFPSDEPIIRKIKGDIYYIEEDDNALQYGGIYGDISLEGAGFIIESDHTECSPNFDIVYLGLFDSRELRKRPLLPALKGRKYYEYDDLLDFFNPPFQGDYLSETKINRNHFESYLTDLFVKAVNSPEEKERLATFSKSAKTLRIIPHLETIIQQISKPLSISLNDINQLVALLSEVKQQTEDSSKVLESVKKDTEDIKLDTVAILHELDDLTKKVNELRLEHLSGAIEEKRFFELISDTVEQKLKGINTSQIEMRLKREFSFLDDEFFGDSRFEKIKVLLCTAEYIYFEAISKNIDIDLSPVVIEYAKILESTLQEKIGDPIISENKNSDKGWKGFQVIHNTVNKLVKPDNLGSWIYLTDGNSSEFAKWVLEKFSKDSQLGNFLSNKLGKYTEKIRSVRNGSAHEAIYGIGEAKKIKRIFTEEKTDLGVTLLEICIKITAYKN